MRKEMLFVLCALACASCKKQVNETMIESSSISNATVDPNLLWDGDASNGTGVFRDLDLRNGSLEIITDSVLNAPVFSFLTYNVSTNTTNDRAEGSHAGNVTMQNNRTYYFGWKQKYGDPFPTPTSTNWVNVFQWKANPAVGGFNYPIYIRADSDNLRVEYQNLDGSASVAWALGSLPVDTWVSWVLAIHTSPDPTVGYVEIWYNGEHKAKVFMKTFDTRASVGPKWGIYRTTRIEPDGKTFLWRPRCGTTYESVDPTVL